jgi:hypothetical protein
MARSRHAIEDFQVANDAYIAALVTVYEANPDGSASATKATLYADLSGLSTLNNPQSLDSTGKFNQPVYIDKDVVCSASAGAASGETGVIQYGGSYRSTYLTATRYFTHDIITGPAGQVPDVAGNLYGSNEIFDSTNWATDLPRLTLLVDYQGAIANIALATRANINALNAVKAMPADQFKDSIFDATGKHLIPLGPGSLAPDTSTAGGGPSFASNLTTTNKVPYRSIDFDGATQENAGVKISGPKSADETVTITYQVRWTALAGTPGQGVVWGVSITGVGDDDTLDVSYSAAVKVTDTLLALGDEHVTTISAAVTVKNWAQGDSLNILVSRFPGDAGDTMSGADAKLTGLDFFLTTNAANDA